MAIIDIAHRTEAQTVLNLLVLVLVVATLGLDAYAFSTF